MLTRRESFGAVIAGILSTLGLGTVKYKAEDKKEILSLLRAHEWGFTAYKQCWVCHGYSPNCEASKRRHYGYELGHRDDCKLAETIESLDGVAHRVGLEFNWERHRREFTCVYSSKQAERIINGCRCMGLIA